MTTGPSEQPLVALTELSPSEQQGLRKEHPEVAGHPSVLVSSPNREILDEFRDMTRLLGDLPDLASVHFMMKALQNIVRHADHATLQAMAKTTPSIEPIREMINTRMERAAAAEFHVQRNVQSRAAFVAEFNLYTADQLLTRFGISADALEELERSNQIFSVEYLQTKYFPLFQFDDAGKPVLATSRVVQLFRGGGWETALWFTSSNGWLDGERPVDALPHDPDAVVEAADQEVGFEA